MPETIEPHVRAIRQSVYFTTQIGLGLQSNVTFTFDPLKAARIPNEDVYGLPFRVRRPTCSSTNSDVNSLCLTGTAAERRYAPGSVNKCCLTGDARTDTHYRPFLRQSTPA